MAVGPQPLTKMSKWVETMRDIYRDTDTCFMMASRYTDLYFGIYLFIFICDRVSLLPRGFTFESLWMWFWWEKTMTPFVTMFFVRFIILHTKYTQVPDNTTEKIQ